MATRRVKQPRALRTRESIVQAAAQVFDELGYSGSSIAKIVERCGTTPGAVYFHFKSKEALADAVMEAQSRTVLPRLESQRLQRVVDATIVWAHQLQTDPLLRAGVRLTSERGTYQAHVGSPYETWVSILENDLEEAQRAGELQPGVEPRELAEFILEACTGIQMYAAATTRRNDLPVLVERMWRYLLPGVAVPAMITQVLTRSTWTLEPT
ncbi:ScbR family autoregulator-binding transcription factor [Streptomyces sp. NPDC057376]|uniref:ScbR family autoregulator-binding transcription factor n=1 Tax=unclassified Streptomyces TaxID=2593676 RepID=UPI001F52B172|nr:ScbR family autoregulator-binding transcription factor [Streptomyces sp. CB02414]